MGDRQRRRSWTDDIGARYENLKTCRASAQKLEEMRLAVESVKRAEKGDWSKLTMRHARGVSLAYEERGVLLDILEGRLKREKGPKGRGQGKLILHNVVITDFVLTLEEKGCPPQEAVTKAAMKYRLTERTIYKVLKAHRSSLQKFFPASAQIHAAAARQQKASSLPAGSNKKSVARDVKSPPPPRGTRIMIIKTIDEGPDPREEIIDIVEIGSSQVWWPLIAKPDELN